jgi:uncharacterized protein YjbI with pentapeptide repeats
MKSEHAGLSIKKTEAAWVMEYLKTSPHSNPRDLKLNKTIGQFSNRKLWEYAGWAVIQAQNTQRKIWTEAHTISGIDLTHSDFASFTFLFSDFRGADFRMSNFHDTYFVDVDFSYANLQECNLNHVSLQRCSFYSADMRATVLPETIYKLMDCDLSGADMSQSIYDGILFPPNATGIDLRNTKLTRCDLTVTDFSLGNLEGITIISSTLSKARMLYGHMPNALMTSFLCLDADFSYTNMNGLMADDVVFKSSSFQGCSLVGASFKKCIFTECNFRYADLTGCNFTGCLLDFADFSGAIMTNTNLNKCQLPFAEFSSASLVNAQLEDAKMLGCNFGHADFTGTQMHRSIFSSLPKNLTKGQVSEIVLLEFNPNVSARNFEPGILICGKNELINSLLKCLFDLGHVGLTAPTLFKHLGWLEDFADRYTGEYPLSPISEEFNALLVALWAEVT